MEFLDEALRIIQRCKSVVTGRSSLVELGTVSVTECCLPERFNRRGLKIQRHG